jgi:hypothetical protein
VLDRNTCSFHDTRDEILKSYPSVRPEHLNAAVAYAAKLAREASLLALALMRVKGSDVRAPALADLAPKSISPAACSSSLKPASELADHR